MSIDARDRVKMMMDLRGWSHAQLAMKAGVSRSTITKFIAKERADMGAKKLAAIANAFDVSLDWLMGKPRSKAMLPLDEEDLLRAYRSIPPTHPLRRAAISMVKELADSLYDKGE